MPGFVQNAAFPVLLLSLAACGDSVGPAPRNVAEARALWESRHLTTYSYFGSQTSFAGNSGTVRVDVADGKVVAVTDMATHTELGTVGWLTIDQLLTLAETLQPTPVEFDRGLGFPKRVERCCMTDDSGAIYSVFSVYLIPLS